MRPSTRSTSCWGCRPNRRAYWPTSASHWAEKPSWTSSTPCCRGPSSPWSPRKPSTTMRMPLSRGWTCSRTDHISSRWMRPIWSPSWQVISGLSGADTRSVIGGYWTSDPNDCFAKLSSAKGLEDSRKARMTVHFTISRSDTLQHSYDACMVPVKAKDGEKSRNQLEICGRLFEAFARRNADCVPIGVAYDGGSTNTDLSKLTLGILSNQALATSTFCSYEPMQLKHLPFKILHYKGNPIFGSQDSLHFLKRFHTPSLFGESHCELGLVPGGSQLHAVSWTAVEGFRRLR